MRPTLQVFRAKEFTGGRNTVVSADDLRPNESPDELNVDGRVVGSLAKRQGYRRWVPSRIGPDPITGLYRYYQQDGTARLMILSGNELWEYVGRPDTGSLNLIAPDALAGYSSFTNPSWMTFAVMQDWCYMGNYEDLIYRWDGTNLFPLGLVVPQEASSYAFANGFASGDSDMVQDKEHLYAISFTYGALGESKVSFIGVAYADSTAGPPAEDSIQLTQLDNANLIGDETPTKVNIYRSLAYTIGVLPAVNDRGAWDRTPLYYVDSVDYGTASYTDKYADDALVNLYNDTTLAVADLPQAAYVVEHRNRMWYGRVQLPNEASPGPGFHSRVYFSDLYQPDRVANFIDVFPEDGDEITAIVSHHNNLVVFKNTKTYLILGSTELDFEVRLIHGNIGCGSPRTPKIMHNRILFLGSDKAVYAFDGANFERLSDKVKPDLEAIPRNNMDIAAGGVWRQRYYLAYNDGSDSP